MKRHLSYILSVLVLVILISIPGTVLAVVEFKVSNYSDGHQIWFEAEAFDERNPATDQYFPITEEGTAPKAPDGAFGKAITRAGGKGGMIRYSFDISKAGGKAGEWFLWIRLISPNNQSDYMLIEGDPDDQEIPAGPPFPGDNETPPFLNADDRVFEETATKWTWVRPADMQGHRKNLRDGMNNMYVYHRQGDNTTFWDTFVWADKEDYKPTDDDYNNAKAFGLSAVRPSSKLSTAWGKIKDVTY